MLQSANERIESDSMGNVPVPGWAYWGAQTQRAVDNFSVSVHRIPQPMVRALALIKKHAAKTNGDLQIVSLELTGAIEKAADEVLNGKWDQHFPIDVFQTGSGSSWNMNANEVIANRACDILGHPMGKRHPVHPNDHVNQGQSSNDVIPSAIHIANRMEVPGLIDSVRRLQGSFQTKAEEFASVVKIGRTHLQDAVPMALGQEFEGYAVQMKKSAERIERTFGNLEELALGGTAVGTGLNAHPDFAERTIAGIAAETGIPFRPAESKFEAIANRDTQVELAGAFNSLAVSLMKIANDLRILAGGPRAGLGEITLPSLQPGSSIMPGKINPVIPEMIIQVAAYVMGKVTAISVGGQNAPLELNMMNPLIAYETLSAISILDESCSAFATRCVDGIVADAQRCEYWIEWSLALGTPLATRIGYDKAAELAHIAFEQKRTIREVVKESGLLSDNEVDELLDPRSMI